MRPETLVVGDTVSKAYERMCQRYARSKARFEPQERTEAYSQPRSARDEGGASQGLLQAEDYKERRRTTA